jgi:hypothetical protein
MKLPYGEADFYSLITKGYVYVDRTDRIRRLEELGEALLFLRPRRFGKSLWLRTLSCYYDLRYRDEHDLLFGGLAAGAEPTELAHRYFVLEWDFSVIAPELSAHGLGFVINSYVNQQIRGFLSDYREHLPSPGPGEALSLTMGDVAVDNLEGLLALIRQTPYRLCLLVDEYDNFANEVMMADPEAYRGLVRADGPLRALMKWVKQAKKGRGLERLYFTGVSPIVMADVTSGMNILKDVSQRPQLDDLCGFREEEIRDLLVRLAAEQPSAGRWTVDEALGMMHTWYNGYRFAPEADGKVYNPTLVLYFLDWLQSYRGYPPQMLDANLSMDESKLTYLAREIPGQQAVMDVLQKDEPIEVDRIVDRFSLEEMVTSEGHHRTYLGSFLYYFGMLTLKGNWTSGGKLELTPPNLVTRKLYIDHVRRLLLVGEKDPDTPEDVPHALMTKGDVKPLAAYVEQQVFRRFSNLDYRWMNELAVKTAFLALLFKDRSYVIFSEPELDRSRADLCLLRRPDAREGSLWDLLLEFKYVKLRDLPGRPSGDELRQRPDAELLALKPVADAFAAAEVQLARYRGVLAERFGVDLRLRSYAVVALGFERLLAREALPEAR